MNMAQNAAAFQDIMNDLQSFTNGMMVDEDGWQVPTQEFLSQTHEPPKGPPPASRRVGECRFTLPLNTALFA